jgi:WD40 repeat protein
MTPDGRSALCCYADGTLVSWDIDDGIPACLPDHPAGRAIAIDPTGCWLLSTSWDGILKLWQFDQYRKLKEWSSEVGAVICVALSNEAQLVLAASLDRKLHVWRVNHGITISTEKIAVFVADEAINCCALSQDGETAVAGDASGAVHLLRLEGQANKVLAARKGRP